MLTLKDIPREAERDVVEILKGEYDVALSSPPKSVLDIGANIGAFSIWANHKWPDAQIEAYEPWPENADSFEVNTNGVSNVHLSRVGVRGHTSFGVMHMGRNRMCCSFHETDGPEINVAFVDAASLGSFEFVKLDCEGSELDILRRLDLSETKALVVEVHNKAELGCVQDLVERAGLNRIYCEPSVNGCYLAKFARKESLASKPRKLFIAVPIYGSVNAHWMQCLLKLVKNPPCNFTVKFVIGDSLVSRARNTLTAEFIRSDCDEMLFIDSDLIFSGEHITTLMSHDCGVYPVVAGFYPKKQEGNVQWVCNTYPELRPVQENGLQEVRYAGTGFLKVHRSVFEQMREKYDLEYISDGTTNTEWDFWTVGIYKDPITKRTRYLSEDWYFCQRWIDMGGKVWADTRIIAKHCGEVAFPLKTQIKEMEELMETAKS